MKRKLSFIINKVTNPPVPENYMMAESSRNSNTSVQMTSEGVDIKVSSDLRVDSMKELDHFKTQSKETIISLGETKSNNRSVSITIPANKIPTIKSPNECMRYDIERLTEFLYHIVLKSKALPKKPDALPYDLTRRLSNVRDNHDSLKSQIREVKRNLGTIEKILVELNKYGLDSHYICDFDKVCRGIRNRIKAFESECKEDLKPSSCIHKFLEVCKSFIQDISKDDEAQDESTHRINLSKTSTAAEDVETLVEELNVAIKLSAIAKENGLISESIDTFVKSCERIKNHLHQKMLARPILSDLRANVDNVMGLVCKLKSDGFVTNSLDDFERDCQEAKDKLDECNLPPKLICGKTCVSYLPNNENFRQLYSRSTVASQTNDSTNSKSHGIKDYVVDILNPNKLREGVTTNDSCCSHDKTNRDSKISKNNSFNNKNKNVDCKLDFVEEITRTVVKIKRKHNKDGTIDEEQETVTVQKRKLDPNFKKILEFGDSFDEALAMPSEEYRERKEKAKMEEMKRQKCNFVDKAVAVNFGLSQSHECNFPSNTIKSKSEHYFGRAPMAIPMLKDSLSLVSVVEVNSITVLSNYSFDFV